MPTPWGISAKWLLGMTEPYQTVAGDIMLQVEILAICI
jgi:hypothetical protein